MTTADIDEVLAEVGPRTPRNVTLAALAAEAGGFDTSVPHWFGAAGDRSVEILSILSHRREPIRRRAVPGRPRGRR